MAEIKSANLRNVIAGMMERQAEATKAKPVGVLGTLWEKATGEIDLYNKALMEHAKLKTKQHRTLIQMEKAQSKLQKIEKEIREGTIKGTKARKKATEQVEKLREEIEKLHESNEELAESVNNSTQKMQKMNRGGGIFRNGLTVLAGKVGAAAAAFGGFSKALEGVEKRMALASMTVGDFGALHVAPTMDKTESYMQVMKRIAGVAYDWHKEMTASSKELMKLGINTEEAHKIMGTYATGLRLATENEDELLKRTGQMTKDTGFLATMLRVDTDTLASATVDASKRFHRATGDMADDLAGLYYTFQGIRKTSDDVVLNFGDLTRATLEAQSSFQGYNFNARATANIMGNVVAKAQELSTTYQMAMEGAKGLAGVLTGGKAPKWAKYIAGRDLLQQVRKTVADVKKEGLQSGIREALVSQFNIKPGDLEGLTETQLALAKTFSVDPTSEIGKKQIEGLQNLSKNYRKYGPLSSSLMTEEILRGTDLGMKAMFKMIKKHADAPEGREMLMQVWGIDEAAATAAVLSLQSMENLEDMAKLRDEAKKATKLRGPPTVKDLQDQTKDFAEAIGQSKAGISGMIKNVWDWMKENPFFSGAVGIAGGLASAILPILQSGIGQALGNVMTGGPVGRVLGKIGGALATPFRWMGRGIGRAAGGVARGAGAAGGAIARGAGAAARGAGTAAGTIARGAGTAATAASGGIWKVLKAAGGGLKNVVTGLGRHLGTAGKALGSAVMRLGPMLARVGGAVAGSMGGLAKAALPLLGKAGLPALAVGAGFAVGSLLRMVPGVDSVTEGLFDSASKLLGFSHATEDAEDAQKALANTSKGVRDAIKLVSKGIVDDYEKDSLARTKAVVMLKGMQDEDLEAYAEKIAATGKLTKKEAMVRLKTLRDEEVDHEKWQRQREEAMEPPVTPPGNVVPVPTPGMTVAQALTPQVAAPAVAPAGPGAPTALPARGRRRAGRGPVGRQPEATATNARVDPDSSISMTLTIPGNALARSTAQAAGMSE